MSSVAWTRAPALDGVRQRVWILGAWACGRSLVFLTAAIVGAVGPRGYTGHEENSSLFGLLGSWDGRWYRTVAANGYLLEPGRQSDPAFFPLFPMLMRLGHSAGVSYTTAGIIVSNIAFPIALVLFEQLSREMLGGEAARRATLLLAVVPLGFVFSLAYPESVVLALIVGAALAARRDRWLLTGLLLSAATLARPESLFIALPLAPLAWKERSAASVGAILSPFAALGSFALYLGDTLGDPLAWTHAERAWGRRFTPLGPVRAIQDLPQAFAANPGVVRDIVCFVVYLLLIGLAYRRGVARAWVVAAALVILLPTFSGSFHSIGRFGLLAPAIVWGAAAVPRQRVVLAVSAVLLVAGVATLPLVFP